MNRSYCAPPGSFVLLKYLFSSVYAIKSIIMRYFATWACVFVFKSVKHVWMWQVSEHPANWNGANVLFHQLKTTLPCYSMCRVLREVACAVLKSVCFWCRYAFKWLVLCVFLLDLFVHWCSKCYDMWWYHISEHRWKRSCAVNMYALALKSLLHWRYTYFTRIRRCINVDTHWFCLG